MGLSFEEASRRNWGRAADGGTPRDEPFVVDESNRTLNHGTLRSQAKSSRTNAEFASARGRKRAASCAVLLTGCGRGWYPAAFLEFRHPDVERLARTERSCGSCQPRCPNGHGRRGIGDPANAALPREVGGFFGVFSKKTVDRAARHSACGWSLSRSGARPTASAIE